MSKHTPGPWKAELSPGRGVLSVVSETTWICGEIQNGTLSDEEAWANARLIAAATDLYVSVVELVDAMVRYEMDVDAEADVPSRHRRMMEKARAAIAKAEGRS